MPSEAQFEDLREWLRDPENEIGAHAPAGVHRQQLEDIWHEALHIAGGDIPEALRIAVVATDTDAGWGETRDRGAGDPYMLYRYRQDGIPSRAFGMTGDYVGVDKVKHFFRCAELAYQTHFDSGVRFAGKAYEAWNWVAGLHDGTGKYDHGDIWADNLGVAFGMMLVDNPRQSIYRFLQNPNQDVLVIEGVSVYEGNYISEIVIPSPRLVERGESMELRMIDDDGNPYVIVVQGDSGGVRYLRTNSSNYYVGKGDPWYRPPRERDTIDIRPARAAIAEGRAIRREIKNKERIAQRLSNNIEQNRRRQDRMREEMGANPIMSQKVNFETLNDWIRQDQERQARILEDLNRLDSQLRELRQPHANMEPVHNSIHHRPSYEPGYREPAPNPIHDPIHHRTPFQDNTIAPQSRSETLHRDAEDRAQRQRDEQQRRTDEQHQKLQEHHRQEQERIQNQHKHLDPSQPHHDHQKHHEQQRQHDEQQKLNDKGLFS